MEEVARRPRADGVMGLRVLSSLQRSLPTSTPWSHLHVVVSRVTVERCVRALRSQLSRFYRIILNVQKMCVLILLLVVTVWWNVNLVTLCT